jgi:hypothetical protein
MLQKNRHSGKFAFSRVSGEMHIYPESSLVVSLENKRDSRSSFFRLAKASRRETVLE